MTPAFNDRLYALLPVVVRQRDAENSDAPLRSLLSVISEQVELVENDVAQLYENWFIETCQNWVVPYIGDLIGYRPIHDAGEPTLGSTSADLARDRILIPRRDVANTIRARRRKGTLALLEELARDVAGWPAVAVEFDRLAALTQAVDDVETGRGRTIDVRERQSLRWLGGAYDRVARVAQVRGPAPGAASDSLPTSGVGLFAARLRAYPISRCAAAPVEGPGDHRFTFSPLGNDMPLFAGAGLPMALARDDVASDVHYGLAKSLAIWTRNEDRAGRPKLVPLDAILPADLSHWRHRPPPGNVAVDAVLGRLRFPHDVDAPARVLVGYHYGFSAEIGGGEFPRKLDDPAVVYTVSRAGGEGHDRLKHALLRWKEDHPPRAIVEFADSEIYDEDELEIDLEEGQSLEIRAASGTRPVIRLIDWRSGDAEMLHVRGARSSSLTLDGLMLAERGIRLSGLAQLTIRQSTLVPGWTLHAGRHGRHADKPSIVIHDAPTSVRIERSITGPIAVIRGERAAVPNRIDIADSIVDATTLHGLAIWSPDASAAQVSLRVVRSTVFGGARVHALPLAENSIFTGRVAVTDRQEGCVRFCYVPSESRTPARYECQPDLTPGTAPAFVSAQYGNPGYARLSDAGSDRIRRGADDESEMGVFHDLYLPQRAANLQARLAEYIPANVDVAVIYVS